MDWKENKAEEILRQYVATVRQQEVHVKLRRHERSAAIRYAVAVAACIVIGLFLLTDRSEMVYGYINNMPITEKEQARELTRQMFNDLALGMAPAEDELRNLFKL